MRDPVSPPKPPTGGSKPVAFDRDAAVEILAQTRYVRGLRRNGAAARRTPRGDGGSELILARTNAAIASGSSGPVTVYNADGVTLGSQTLTAYLKLSGTLAANTNVYLASIKGKWHVISADCP